jgi:YVTN family beta-propeller protein
MTSRVRSEAITSVTSVSNATPVHRPSDTLTVYVADYSTDEVSVIDTATDKVTNITLPSGSDPYGVAAFSGSDTVYVTDFGTDEVSVINGTHNTLTTNIFLPSGAQPKFVAGLW